MKNLTPQTRHPALITGTHDDRAAQDFAFTLRNHVTSHLMPANRVVHDKRAAPAWARKHGTPPQSPAQVRAAMDDDPWYRFYLSVRRTSQELIWSSVIPAVDAAPEPAPPPPAGGSLTLDPDFTPPRYVSAVDIHCMPGGYCLDRGEEDWGIGAVYDRGVYLYMSGLMGPMNDGIGRLAAHWLSQHHPDFQPQRLLDMGCAVGHGTLPFAAQYPQAQVHALDAGAALLRYGHRRAEALGVPVHFRQGNAEATPYPDGHFDLVTSVIMLHETSNRSLPAIFAECHRLLAPGGLMLHIDQPRFDEADAYTTFLQENETFYNNEPFWRRYRRLDLAEIAQQAGFAEVEMDIIPAAVVSQSQNNQKAPPPPGKKLGFSIICARK
jgi:ubiquinone/menaquinone biosynthesis C-methylase UbiE